jgi:hypothetical protein
MALASAASAFVVASSVAVAIALASAVICFLCCHRLLLLLL